MIIYLFVVIQIYKMFSGFLLFYSGYITPISGRAENISAFDVDWRYRLQSTDTFRFVESFDCGQHLLLYVVGAVDCNQ